VQNFTEIMQMREREISFGDYYFRLPGGQAGQPR